jgi:hypothetical protein
MSADISMLNVDGRTMLELTHFNEQKQFRIIPSVYPPINFFEDLVDPDEMETLFEIEALTNDRLRQEVGDIHLVAKEDRISGSGSSVIMAAFTHLAKETRFSNNSYGVYYAGFSKETAIRETVYHREKFLRATNEESTELTMRMYEGIILKPLHDIRNDKFIDLHHPHDYSKAQEFGKDLRSTNSWGIVYNSVRHAGGVCIAAFKPRTVSIPNQTAHLKYIWNGQRISEVLDTQSILKL